MNAKEIAAKWCEGDDLVNDIQTAIDEAKAEEREECAKIADDYPETLNPDWGYQIARLIRRRG